MDAMQIPIIDPMDEKHLVKDRNTSLPECFYELNVDFGHQNWVHRDDSVFSETLLDAIASTVRSALETGRPSKIPGRSELKIQIKACADAFRVGIITQVAGDDTEVVTFGVATCSGAGGCLWEKLHHMHGLREFVDFPGHSIPEAPPSPWILRRSSLALFKLGKPLNSFITELGRYIAWLLADRGIEADKNIWSSTPGHPHGAYWMTYDATNPLIAAHDEGAFFNANIMIEPTIQLKNLNVKREHVKELSSGNIKLALFYRNRVIFLLVKIGSLSWFSAPFNASLYGPALAGIDPQWCPGDKIKVSLDYHFSGGNHRGFGRDVLLDERFSETLVTLVRLQTLQPMTLDEYREAVIELDKHYPSPKEMLSKALVDCDT